MTLLRSLDVTQHLATALEMYADTPNVTSLQGYQILHAAHRLMAPNKPKSWEYFLATARRITREEVDHASTHASTNGQAPLLPREPDRIR